MSSETLELAPTWLRELSVLFGTVALIFGFLAIAFPYMPFILPPGTVGLPSMQLTYLGGALALVGILTLLPTLDLFGATLPIGMLWRLLDLIFATVMTILALVSVIGIYPLFMIIIYLLAAALLMHGITDFVRGMFVKRLPFWYRLLHFIFGALYIIFFVVVLAAPFFLTAALIPIVIAFATILLGLQHTFHGLTGAV
jgi:hypothetical protein